MSFLISHSMLKFDIWAFLALLLVVAAAIYWYFGMRKLNKEKKALEEAAAAEYNDAGATQAASNDAKPEAPKAE